MKWLSLILLASLSIHVSAREFKVAEIVSDLDTNVTDFLMELNQDESIHSIRIIRRSPGGQILEDHSFSALQVLQNGAVLYEREGREIIRLSVATNFSLEKGGEARLHYLYNGIRGTWSQMKLKLLHLSGRFALFTDNGDEINHFLVRAHRRPVVGVVGVREIIPSKKK